MDWGQLILSLFITIFFVIFILQEDNEDDYVYSTLVPIGIPNIEYYPLDDSRRAYPLDDSRRGYPLDDSQRGYNTFQQNMLSISFQLSKKDIYEYIFKSDDNQNITNVRVETEDKTILLKLKPSEKSISNEIYLTSAHRRCIKNERSYLVYNLNGKEKRMRLMKKKKL